MLLRFEKNSLFISFTLLIFINIAVASQKTTQTPPLTRTESGTSTSSATGELASMINSQHFGYQDELVKSQEQLSKEKKKSAFCVLYLKYSTDKFKNEAAALTSKIEELNKANRAKRQEIERLNAQAEQNRREREQKRARFSGIDHDDLDIYPV